MPCITLFHYLVPSSLHFFASGMHWNAMWCPMRKTIRDPTEGGRPQSLHTHSQYDPIQKAIIWVCTLGPMNRLLLKCHINLVEKYRLGPCPNEEAQESVGNRDGERDASVLHWVLSYSRNEVLNRPGLYSSVLFVAGMLSTGLLNSSKCLTFPHSLQYLSLSLSLVFK